MSSTPFEICTSYYIMHSAHSFIRSHFERKQQINSRIPQIYLNIMKHLIYKIPTKEL